MKSQIRKILWLSNCQFTDSPANASGTWLLSMGEALSKSDNLEIYNVTKGNVISISNNSAKGVTQWVVPKEKLSRKGFPSKKTIESIKNIYKTVQPDLIHIWGTEDYWGMLSTKGIFDKTPVLLDMQGILYAYAKVYYANLSFGEIFRCFGIRELLKPQQFVLFAKRNFEKRGKNEKLIIKNTKYISYQSNYVKNHIRINNNDCTLFETGIMLREEFCNSKPWQLNKQLEPTLFTSASGSTTYKGLHVAIRAIHILKKTFPNIKLNIAGKVQTGKVKGYGYANWLQKLINDLGLKENVIWLGPLNASQIVDEFHKSSMVVIPSFVETYCLAYAEAMIVGVPTVATYSSALTELGIDRHNTLFFPIGDSVMLAYRIKEILEDEKLAEKIGTNARQIGLKRNNGEDILSKQKRIYKKILDDNEV